MSNATNYFKPEAVPPADVFVPHGQMLSVQTYQDAEGHSDPALKSVLLPDRAKDTWRTPLYIVIAAGPNCKWTKRGDIVPVPIQVQFPVVRVCGWVFLCCHEEQSLGVVPSMHVELDTPLEQTK